MGCPTGQIQVGIDPQTNQPICVDGSVLNGSGNVQTGATRGSWWSQVLTSMPDILGGVADVIGANKGNNTPDTIVLQSTLPPKETDSKINWGWVILAVVVVGVVILGVFLRKKNT